NYREAYNLFATNGILFNHESPRRGEVFVTRKITRALASLLSGAQKKLFIGNLDAKRDWGFAPEYVEIMWKMLQLQESGDFVVGTGSSYSVREFLEAAFAYAGVNIEWRESGLKEQGLVAGAPSGSPLKQGTVIVEIDPKYFRPTEVHALKADSSKAQKALGWSPRVSFDDLVQILVDHDMLAQGLTPPGDGITRVQSLGFSWTTHDLTLLEKIRHEVG
ncbi:MAG: GDP-mannose 4,6-dehydratase, partial [Ignavibacteriales bacterium]|nr:GDP-mannose 4,6-dehydratase [Ignavibacteriales bacterium]